MHILLLDLGLTLRGSQKQLLNLARALREMPDAPAVCVACPANSGLAAAVAELGADFELDLLPLSSASPRNPASLWRIYRRARRVGRLIIHTHGPRAAAMGALCKRLFPKYALLVHTRADCLPVPPGRRSKDYAKADAVVGVSAETAHLVLETGIPPERVFIVHSGIDPAQYPARRQRDDGRFVFGAAGELEPEKGWNVLVDALAQMEGYSGLPPWEVRIVGQGPMFPEILERAEKAGVAGRLALLGEQDTRHILPECDAVIVASVQAEGSNAVVKEAWAIGLPVVASDLPSNIELVHDEENGLTYFHSNPGALAGALRRVMTDADLREHLAAGGKRSVLRFSHTRTGQAYMRLYKELLERAPVPAKKP